MEARNKKKEDAEQLIIATRENLKVFLTSDEASKHYTYTYFTPKEINKYYSKAKRIIANAIAYKEIYNAIIILDFIMLDLVNVVAKLEFQKVNPQIDKLIEELNFVIKQIKALDGAHSSFYSNLAKIIFHEGNIKPSWEALQIKLSEFVAYCERWKKEEILLILKELDAYLEGIYFYTCVQLKRAHILENLNHDHPNVPLVNYPFGAKEVKVKENQAKFLTAVAHLKSKEALAQFLLLLHIIANQLQNTNHEVNLDAVNICITVLQNTDHIQYLDKTEALILLREFKQKVIAGIERMLAALEKIEVLEQKIYDLLKESCLWLEGFYLHAYHEEKINQASWLPVIDAENTALKSIAGVSKLDIAQYYRDASLIIEKKLKVYDQQSISTKKLVVEKTPDITDKKTASQVFSAKECVQILPSKTPVIPNVDLQQSSMPQIRFGIKANDHGILFTAFFPGNSRNASQNNRIVSCLKDIKKQMSERLSDIYLQPLDDAEIEKKFGIILAEAINRDENSKISALYNGVKAYGLSRNQEIRLGDIAINIRTTCKRYNNGYYFFNRWHNQEATQLINKVNEMEIQPKTKINLAEILKELYIKYSDLNTDGSQHLAKDIKKILLSTYEVLLDMHQLEQKNNFKM